jgi:ribosome-binding protein aMBF1 (putative translation factor)
MAKALTTFARTMSRRTTNGACCVCTAAGASVTINVAGFPLLVCDHLCAYMLGGLTTVALRSRRANNRSRKRPAEPRAARGVTRRTTRAK